MIILMVIGLLFSCRNEIEQIKAITDDHNFPDRVTTNGEYIFTERGKLKHKLVATKLEQYNAQDSSRTVVSEGFIVYVYDTLGTVTSTMSAVNGVLYSKENKLVATDDVVLVNNISRDTLETKKLIWLQDSSKVYSTDTVKITTKDGILYGKKGMTSNDSFDKYRLFDPVGEIYVKEEKNN